MIYLFTGGANVPLHTLHPLLQSIVGSLNASPGDSLFLYAGSEDQKNQVWQVSTNIMTWRIEVFWRSAVLAGGDWSIFPCGVSTVLLTFNMTALKTCAYTSEIEICRNMEQTLKFIMWIHRSDTNKHVGLRQDILLMSPSNKIQKCYTRSTILIVFVSYTQHMFLASCSNYSFKMGWINTIPVKKTVKQEVSIEWVTF